MTTEEMQQKKDEALLKRIENPAPSKMQWTKQYRVFYKHGFGDHSKLVYAADEKEAYAAGLAEFRRTTGHTDVVDPFPADRVIDHVEEA